MACYEAADIQLRQAGVIESRNGVAQLCQIHVVAAETIEAVKAGTSCPGPKFYRPYVEISETAQDRAYRIGNAKLGMLIEEYVAFFKVMSHCGGGPTGGDRGDSQALSVVHRIADASPLYPPEQSFSPGMAAGETRPIKTEICRYQTTITKAQVTAVPCPAVTATRKNQGQQQRERSRDPHVNKCRVEVQCARGADRNNSNQGDGYSINAAMEPSKVIEFLYGGSSSSTAEVDVLDPEADDRWINEALKRLKRLQEELPFTLPSAQFQTEGDSVVDDAETASVGPKMRVLTSGLSFRKD